MIQPYSTIQCKGLIPYPIRPRTHVRPRDELHRQTQQQRYLERQIRGAKTKALCYDAAGDKAAFDQTALRIRERNAEYRAFCKENGLTPRVDRTQVVGYNRKIAGRAQSAVVRADKLDTALRNEPVKLPDGSFSKITDGAPIFDIETFADKNARSELRVRDFLVQNYGGIADEWQHSKARTYIDTESGSRKAVIHWFYEGSVSAREVFVKGWSKK